MTVVFPRLTSASVAALLLLRASQNEVQSFAPTRKRPSAVGRTFRGGSIGVCYSYLDSLSGQDQGGGGEPKFFGQVVKGIDDICAFDAASEDIKSVIAKHGSISAAGIQERIDKSNNVVSIIRHHFPGAIGSSEVLQRVKRVLDSNGVDHVLLTQSVCPDEINHEHGDITDLFIENLGGGKVFHLGGLAGIPFTGKTGFGAYSGHVEDGGHCFVMQAPHIGMSDSLELGKYSREGQSHDGAACGAAVGAMCHCADGKPMPDLASNNNDYQMGYIIHEISKCMPTLESCADDDSRQAELAKQTHRIGKTMLESVLSTNFGDENSMLFILTGIQINMPFDFEDYFQPLSFEVRKKDGSVIDLLSTTF